MSDILFHTDNWVFSYRVAGILLHKGNVLLQRASDDSGYAFPGGHVSFGETNAESLRREFREEINVEVVVKELKWVAEIFFPWKNKPCHQICNYYHVELQDGASIPLEGRFTGKESFEGRNFTIDFHWIPLEKVPETDVYPTNTAKLLHAWDEGIQHFIYREEI